MDENGQKVNWFNYSPILAGINNPPVNQYRVFFCIAWIGLLLQAFLTLAEINAMALYPPFKQTIGFISGIAYGLDWILLLFVFHYYQQKGFIPWIIALYGLLSLVEPAIDISHTPQAADLLKKSDAYLWFNIFAKALLLFVIIALFSVQTKPIAWRTRWIGIFALIGLCVPVMLNFTLKGPQATQVVLYTRLLNVIPLILVAALFRKTRRDKKAANQRSMAVAAGDAAPTLAQPTSHSDLYERT
jgi:hypothetical protein